MVAQQFQHDKSRKLFQDYEFDKSYGEQRNYNRNNYHPLLLVQKLVVVKLLLLRVGDLLMMVVVVSEMMLVIYVDFDWWP